MPPARAMATLPSAFCARLRSAPAAVVQPSGVPSKRRRTSGVMAPAARMAVLFSAFTARFRSAPAALVRP
eukprot:scaffold235896_cov31-Tisochrysis_lutea.AAC.4